ncbi:MAG: hypothetical protein RLZZ501_1666 [Pseudomonadota bacterium]|jgi:glycosyltransferase involved in cell wall biosynthesis
MPSTGGEPVYSIVIPIYNNAASLPELVAALDQVAATVRDRFGLATEAVFVIDGSPDDSAAVLERLLPTVSFPAQLIHHSRNFGSFAAIRTGLAAARGRHVGMIAADLQEPPELLVSFLEPLVGGAADIVVGVREGREDPVRTRLSSALFWRLYRRLVNHEMAAGGVDLFACTAAVRDQLVRLGEAHSSLVGLVYWVGFRRVEVGYHRRARRHGHSGWSLRKRFDYLLDNLFAFTDLPIRLLSLFGLIGTLVVSLVGLVTVAARLLGIITVPGYAQTLLMVMFFGALNTLGIGLVGHYAWRTYENTKRRPLAIVSETRRFGRD